MCVGSCALVGRGDWGVWDGVMTCSDVDVGSASRFAARVTRASTSTSRMMRGTRCPELLGPWPGPTRVDARSRASSTFAGPPSSCSDEILASVGYHLCNCTLTSPARVACKSRTIGNAYVAAQTSSTKKRIRCMARVMRRSRGLCRGGRPNRGWGKVRLVVLSCRGTL